MKKSIFFSDLILKFIYSTSAFQRTRSQHLTLPNKKVREVTVHLSKNVWFIFQKNRWCSRLRFPTHMASFFFGSIRDPLWESAGKIFKYVRKWSKRCSKYVILRISQIDHNWMSTSTGFAAGNVAPVLSVFTSCVHCVAPVSYTHLTLPTKA